MKYLPFKISKAMFYIFLASFIFMQCKKETPLEKVEPTHRNPLAYTQAERDTIMLGDSATAMRIMNIFLHPDSIILRVASRNVIIEDTLNKLLADRMYTSMRTAGGVGIAAPQIGINRRVIWVQRYDKGTTMNRPYEVYLNPRITAYSDTVVRRSDGCLSVPQTPGFPDLKDSSYRALWVQVAYYLPNGDYVNEKITQWFTAHIFQHEIDHLEGIMFFDRYVSENKSLFTILPPDYMDEKDIIEIKEER